MSRTTFLKSTIILTVATLVSKILGSIFRIPLQNIAGDEVLGIFSLVYPVYMVALILSVAGLPIAISKLIAEARSTNESTSSVRAIYYTASILAIAFGVISFLLIFIFSSEIASLLGGSSSRPALIVVAATLLIAPYMAVYRGYFQGFENMRPTAISQMLEQFIRAGFIILFAFYFTSRGYSEETIASWVMVGSILGALASLIYLRMKYQYSPFLTKTSEPYSFKHFRKWSMKTLSVSIPIAIGSITMALFNFVDSFTISNALRLRGVPSEEINYWYGIYSRGLTIAQIATVFASAVVLPLVPLISKQLANNDMKRTKAVIEQTNQLTYLTSWPIAIGILTLALPLNLSLFTDGNGTFIIAVIGLSSVFTCLTLVGTGTLQGMNLAKIAAVIIILGVVMKTISNFILVHQFGLEGAAVSTLLVYLLIFTINTVFIWKNIKFSMLNGSILKIIVSALIMGGVLGIPTWLIDFSEWTRLQALFYVLIATFIGAIIYLVQVILYKAIDKHVVQLLPFPKILNKRE